MLFIFSNDNKKIIYDYMINHFLILIILFIFIYLFDFNYINRLKMEKFFNALYIHELSY